MQVKTAITEATAHMNQVVFIGITESQIYDHGRKKGRKNVVMCEGTPTQTPDTPFKFSHRPL